MDNKVHIDIERISDSLETITSIENIVNYTDLASNFDELDQYFKKVNFEHANCLYYKDHLDDIYDNLDTIKRKINELTEYLRKTKISYESTNEITNKNPKKEISPSSIATSLHKALENEVTKIPSEQAMTEQETSQPINTVPIGIAIGATGVAGSVGAVVVNELYGGNYEEYELEDYVDNEELPDLMDENHKKKIEKKQKKEPEKEVEESNFADDYVEPYQAVRREREADKYYGNQLQNLELDDEEDNSDDDYFKDDFD